MEIKSSLLGVVEKQGVHYRWNFGSVFGLPCQVAKNRAKTCLSMRNPKIMRHSCPESIIRRVEQNAKCTETELMRKMRKRAGRFRKNGLPSNPFPSLVDIHPIICTTQRSTGIPSVARTGVSAKPSGCLHGGCLPLKCYVVTGAASVRTTDSGYAGGRRDDNGEIIHLPRHAQPRIPRTRNYLITDIIIGPVRSLRRRNKEGKNRF